MLTDVQCRNASCPPERKQIRFTDAGGLYLQVTPSGSKRWFYKYRTEGKEKQLAHGSYPAVSLTAARKARDIAKIQRADGQDPIEARKLKKLKGSIEAVSTFKAVALEWHSKQVDRWSPGHAERMYRQLERDLFPFIAERPMESIEPMELLVKQRAKLSRFLG